MVEITLNSSIFPMELKVSKFPAHRGLRPNWPDEKVTLCEISYTKDIQEFQNQMQDLSCETK